jgi:hypothetical protein
VHLNCGFLFALERMVAMEAVATREEPQQVAVRLAYRRVAILAEAPERLKELGRAIYEFAADDILQVFVWIPVECFRAPSGTHPPYRDLARLEARRITEERRSKAEAETAKAVLAWSDFDWHTQIEAIPDLTAAVLARRLRDKEIGLLVASEGGRVSSLAAKAAKEAACPLLLVPVTNRTPTARTPDGDRRLRLPRLISTFHR